MAYSEPSDNITSLGHIRSVFLDTTCFDLLRPNFFYVDFVLGSLAEDEVMKATSSDKFERFATLVKAVSLPSRKITTIEHRRMGKVIQIPTVAEWDQEVTVKFHLDNQRVILGFLEYLYQNSQYRGTTSKFNKFYKIEDKFTDTWGLLVRSVDRRWLLAIDDEKRIDNETEKYTILNQLKSLGKSVASNAAASISFGRSMGIAGWNDPPTVEEIAMAYPLSESDKNNVGFGYFHAFQDIFVKSISGLEFDHGTPDQAMEITVTFGFSDTWLGNLNDKYTSKSLTDVYPFKFSDRQ
jgi:hypothetical protein